MASYCTIDDLLGQISEDVVIGLTDDTGSGQINMDAVDRAIADASSKVDAFCQARYDVPFEPVPKLITGLAVDIAIYNLFSRRGFDDNTADKVVIDRYKEAVRILEMLHLGRMTIGVASPPPPQGVKIRSRRRVYDDDSLDAF